MDMRKYSKVILSPRALISLIISIIFLSSTFINNINYTTFYARIVLLVVTFLLAFISIELFVYIDVLKKNCKYIEFYEKFEKEGIDGYFSEFTSIDIKGNLPLSSRVCMLEIYSNKNFMNNYDHFKEFLSKESNVLEIVLLEKDQGLNCYKYLTEKFGYDSNEIAKRIEDFRKELINFKKNLGDGSGKIIIYYSKYVPQYSLIVFDSTAYVTFYKTAPGRSNRIPVFSVSKKTDSSFYNFIIEDYDYIVKCSRKEEIA
ncbi:MAG: hypothetical protein K6T66_08340 [Peptococcaceae bacterium]|nr:hypothetical protein [Peptococcaceae bacterium]